MQASETIQVEHWVEQLTAPVLFEQAFHNITVNSKHEGKKHPPGVIVEVGPKPVLTKLARALWKQKDVTLLRCG